jgi:hypothetical protein
MTDDCNKTVEAGFGAAHGYGSLADVPLLQTVLCKHKGTTWSEIFEITKFAYSKNGKCVYLRSMFGIPGNQVTNYFWRDVADLDAKYVVFDVMSHNDQRSARAATKRPD